MDIFISTHSPRVGRTKSPVPHSTAQTYFNSLAPCGANPGPLLHSMVVTPFQLTRPVWGEPRNGQTYAVRAVISTHSPRVGRTAARAFAFTICG